MHHEIPYSARCPAIEKWHWDPWPTWQSTEYLLLPSRAVFILTMCSSVSWLSPRCCWFLFVCLLSWQHSFRLLLCCQNSPQAGLGKGEVVGQGQLEPTAVEGF
uniref:Uncharacterized protein n=1 Tax=Buteo japonicus TaxID=224669 RepID=A0A8C0HR34_9AVES